MGATASTARSQARSRWRHLLLVPALVATAVSAAPAAAAPGADEPPVYADPALGAAVDDARPTERIAVEVITGDTRAAERAVRGVGGVVTGSVAGEVLQASIPAGRMDELVAADAIPFVQVARRVNRPVPPRAETGTIVGESVELTNAAAWHAAGLTGGVKVGIVDFFDLGIWRPSEHGPVPDAAHRFCRDSIGAGYCPIALDGSAAGDGHEHGVAVAEVVKDMAPDAELYLATVASVSDLEAAIDWFAANGVGIVTRSLGAPYDGPGDGTGPLDAVVDHATALGITWFNSVGNEGDGRYGRFTGGVTSAGYVDFDNGPGIDDTLSVEGGCIGFDGIRWSNDWGKPANRVTDYQIEVRQSYAPVQIIDARQVDGAPPLEAVDLFACPLDGRIDVRIRRTATGGDRSPDVVEVALFMGELEEGRSQAAWSAAKPVSDSRSPALVAVGAVDPPASGAVAAYSSQGPTNDGRITPHLVAPSCLRSSVYSPALYGPGACFDGTSAAAPVAAGAAALLQARGLAGTGVHLASLVRHLTIDIDRPGPDTASGSGLLRLPPPPPGGVDDRPAQFVPLAAPQRILDTRATSATAGAPLGPFAPFTLVDLPVPAVTEASTVTAVAVTITSVDSPAASYVQALPTLLGRLGAFANLNVASPGQIKPNSAIVPVGAGGSISLYLPTGGNVVVDLMGIFTPAPEGDVASGRYQPLDARRVLDTRTAARPTPGTVVQVGGLPADAIAVVMNVTATEAVGPGFLRVQPTGATGLDTANGNYVAGVDSGTSSIVPVGPDGTVSILTSNATHIVADLMGYITGPTSPPGRDGLFVPITPVRGYDSRDPGNRIHSSLEDRGVRLSGVPDGAVGVSVNLAAVDGVGPGYITLHPSGSPLPVISNLNHPTATPISNSALVGLAPSGGLAIFGNQTAHVIIDVNGYFSGPT